MNIDFKFVMKVLYLLVLALVIWQQNYLAGLVWLLWGLTVMIMDRIIQIAVRRIVDLEERLEYEHPEAV